MMRRAAAIGRRRPAVGESHCLRRRLPPAASPAPFSSSSSSRPRGREKQEETDDLPPAATAEAEFEGEQDEEEMEQMEALYRQHVALMVCATRACGDELEA